MTFPRKSALLFFGAIALQAQQVALSDTLTNAVGGGSFTGRITVTLNAPASAQPLYYSATSLTGWQAVYCLGVTGSDCTTATSAGTFAATLYANSTITPAGTSYAARFAPSKGSPWAEVWVVTPSTTTLRQVRATTTPTPTVTFQPSQIAPGSSGQVLTTSGGVATWAASSGGGAWGSITGTLSAQTDLQSALDGKQATDADLTALAALSTTGIVARTGAATYSPRTITGTANQITVTNGDGVSGAPTISIPTNPTLPGTTTGTFSGALTGNVTGNVSGSSGSTTGNAATATALASNPTDCSAGQFANAIAASGNLTCAAVAYADVSGTPSLAGYVAGAGALTTVGVVPVVTGAGTIGSDLLTFDATDTISGSAALIITNGGNAARLYSFDAGGGSGEAGFISSTPDGVTPQNFSIYGQQFGFGNLAYDLMFTVGDDGTVTVKNNTATTGVTTFQALIGAAQTAKSEVIATDGRMRAALTTPTTSGETCTAGTFTADATYFYVCTALNTWKRILLVAF